MRARGLLGGAVLAAAGLALVRAARARRRAILLDGQVVLITGGSRGLGFLLAREFAREGARLSICARDELELARAVRALEREGAEVLGVRCDVTDRAAVERWVAETIRRYGRLDVLVNNAGIIQVGPVHAMTPADFERALDVIFRGTLYATLAVLPHMLARRSGRIANITSIGGKVSVPHLLPYACAKFAAVGLSEGLRAELARDGIVVVTIVPGLMRTGSYLNAIFKGRPEAEFRWFALAATLPLLSMDAERAARQIVRAVRRGEAERTLTLPAALLARFHGLFPALTADLLGLAGRVLLPRAGPVAAEARGIEIAARAQGPVLSALTARGRAAARRFHEYPGPAVTGAGGAPGGQGAARGAGETSSSS